MMPDALLEKKSLVVHLWVRCDEGAAAAAEKLQGLCGTRILGERRHLEGI